MQQQKSKKGLRATISSYFRLLCGRPSDPPKIEEEDIIEHRPTLKRKRLTFLLDRALIKLSRRNIAVEEFRAKTQLQEEIEKHLAQRLNNIALAVFEGPFSELATRTVYFPVIFMSSPPPPFNYISPNNQIVTNQPFPLRKIPKGVEAYILWVGNDAALTIEAALHRLNQLVEHFVFLCQGEVDLRHLHQLFLLYRQDYMFQVQRVMVLDKCVRYIIYVSRSEQFLCIDRGSLIEFFVQELAKRDECFDRLHFACLLDKLFDSGMYVEAASVLGELKVTTDQIFEFDKEFMMMIQERYTYTYPIVKRVSDAKLKKGKSTKDDEESVSVPKFHQNTPLFGGIERSSIRGIMSQTGSIISRRNLAVSFGRPISRNMGNWDDI